MQGYCYSMRVFISYHRADYKYRHKVENILTSVGIEYYAVPEDSDFNGKKAETIKSFICNKLKKCDVMICLVGNETYSRPHVDREIHTALKGEVGVRLGNIAVHLPSRNDSLKSIDKNTYPKKLLDNKIYVVWSDYSELNSNIEVLINNAYQNSLNRKLQTNHTHPCLPLRSTLYYEY